MTLTHQKQARRQGGKKGTAVPGPKLERGPACLRIPTLFYYPFSVYNTIELIAVNKIIKIVGYACQHPLR